MRRSFIRNAIVSAAAIVVLAGTGYGGWRVLAVPADKTATGTLAPTDPRLANVMTLALARIP